MKQVISDGQTFVSSVLKPPNAYETVHKISFLQNGDVIHVSRNSQEQIGMLNGYSNPKYKNEKTGLPALQSESGKFVVYKYSIKNRTFTPNPKPFGTKIF